MTQIDADILISNGTIVTADPQNDIISKGNIAVKNDIIVHIGKNDASMPIHFKNKIDADGCIVMPGLINTHTHMPMSIFRGYADDLELMTWLNEYMFPAEARHIHPENVKAGTFLSCAEMLLGGITTVCDGYFFEDIVATHFAESGMRGILAQGVIDFPAPGVPDPSQNIAAASDYVAKWNHTSPLLSPSIFCHSPYTCSSDTLKNAKKQAEKNGVLFQIHAAETLSECELIKKEHGVSPVKYLDSLNILNERTLLVHAVYLNQNDIEIIQKTGAKVSHNPESNMKLSSGISPVPELIKAGISVGLGTDSCASNNDLDLFSEMDMAAKIHKVKTLDPTIMDAEKVIKMATIQGAEAIGISKMTGSLEIGKQADIIIVDTNKPHLFPMYNPISHIVYSVKSADVRDVFVAGKMVVENRKLLTLDLENIFQSIKLIQEHIKL